MNCLACVDHKLNSLSSLSADSSRELDVLWHYGDSLSVNCAQVRVLEQTDQVCLSRFLQGADCSCLKPEVGLEVLCNLSNKPTIKLLQLQFAYVRNEL